MALLLQKYGPITPAQAKSYLIAHAVVDSFTGPVWNNSWGYGKLFLGDLSDPVVAPTSDPAGDFVLILRSANPARGAIDVEFVAPRDAQVLVAVYDIGGRRVATLARGRFTAGRHRARFDGAGASGIYFVRLSAPGREIVRMVVAVR